MVAPLRNVSHKINGVLLSVLLQQDLLAAKEASKLILSSIYHAALVALCASPMPCPGGRQRLGGGRGPHCCTVSTMC